MSLNSSLKRSGQESLRAVYTLYGKWLQIEACVCLRGIAQCICSHLRECGLWSIFSAFSIIFVCFSCVFQNPALLWQKWWIFWWARAAADYFIFSIDWWLVWSLKYQNIVKKMSVSMPSKFLFFPINSPGPKSKIVLCQSVSKAI